MSTNIKTLAAIFALASVMTFATRNAEAQGTTPPAATATRPAASGPDQSSVPNAAPPASRTQTTGQAPPDPTIKQMNDAERSKVEREGK
jgi:hypothetical protein